MRAKRTAPGPPIRGDPYLSSQLSALSSAFSNERGQLVIPALFVIPSLVLFIYLIYETANLSTHKIRHQFALDTAVFVEMTNYSDLLNRTAYVNGAFPARVCYEAFSDPDLNQDPKPMFSGRPPMNLYEYLRDHGLCPYSPRCKGVEQNCPILMDPGTSDWGFTYNTSFGCCDWQAACNCTEGRDKADPPDSRPFYLFDWGTMNIYGVMVPILEMVLNNYMLIFNLLKVVEDSQIMVFQRLTGGHYFFRRAYAMNLAGDRDNNATSMSQLPKIFPRTYTTSLMKSWVNVFNPGTQTLDPVPVGPNPMELLVVTTVKGLDSQQGIPRREIRQSWDPGPNYFLVDTERLLGRKPFVHASVEVSGGSVWPGATPRYQVRLYP